MTSTTCTTRVCADDRCGKPLPADADPRARYCARKCLLRVSARTAARARSKSGRTNRQPDFIRRLRAEVPEGQCVYCKGPLTTRQRFMCAKPKCRTAYSADHRRERRTGKDLPAAMAHDSPGAVLAAELRASTARLAVQFDGFRARVREFCASVLEGAR